MDFTYCKECQTYHKEGKCNPIFKVYDPDWYGDEFGEIRASSFENAAERYGLKRSDDSPFEDEIEIEDNSGERKRFSLIPRIVLEFEIKELPLTNPQL